MAEQMHANGNYDFGIGTSDVTDLDNLKTAGVYPFNLSSKDPNAIALGYQWGTVTVLRTYRAWAVTQIVRTTKNTDEKIYYRQIYDLDASTPTWSKWYILGFGVENTKGLASVVANHINGTDLAILKDKLKAIW